MGVRGKKRHRLNYGGLDFWNHVSTVDMDADGDGKVAFADFLLLAESFGLSE